MHKRTLIVGGGLSGLSLAYRLQQAGRDFHLVEARARLGGRIKSLDVNGVKCDLGPSWVWPGQHRVAAIARELGLQLFDQWSTGDQLFEHPGAEVQRNAGFMSMAGSLRIAGGTSALTDALATQLDPAKVQTGCAVRAIENESVAHLTDGQTITADRIVLCMPPRLAAKLTITPALPQAAQSALQSIPTWMGAHAKFVAAYSTPFWRSIGLSGDASSRRGPMVEIHDASPDDGAIGALFGFIGIPAAQRAQLGDTLEEAAMDQLVNLFGPQAGTPIATKLEDWSQDPLTATPADATTPPGHPPYKMPQAVQEISNKKLLFAMTEMAPDNGGLIEGALAAAEHAATQILGA